MKLEGRSVVYVLLMLVVISVHEFTEHEYYWGFLAFFAALCAGIRAAAGERP